MTRRPSSSIPAWRSFGAFGILVPPRLEVVAVDVVFRLRELEVLVDAVEAVGELLDLLLALVHLRAVRLDQLLRLGALLAEAVHGGFVYFLVELLDAGRRDLLLENREAALVAFPLAVVVVPYHPDDRHEEEDARRREHDVEEVDVIGVPDALFLCHSIRYQILKKNSGIATMYFKLKIHRISIFAGSDIIIRNRNTVT